MATTTSTLAFRKQLADELSLLRTRGLDKPRINKLDGLLKVAKALTTDGSEIERIEAVLEQAITEYGPTSTNYQVARLWFGLDPTTRQLGVKNRHEVAWQRYGGESEVVYDTFTTHRWPDEFRDVLAERLAERYAKHLMTPRSSTSETSKIATDFEPLNEEPAAQVSQTRRAATFRKAHWRVRLAVLFASCILALSLWLFVFSRSSPHPRRAKIPVVHENYSLLAPANMPEIIRGSGTETTHASGYYGKRAFVARGGVVLFQRNQDEFEIILFPEPVSCALWYRGTPAGIEFDINVYANAKTLQNVPIGRPLNEYYINWVTDRGNNSNLDTAAASRDFDGLGEPGLVILTTIETTSGGFWRGRITTRGSKTAGGVRQAFNGTFAAQWCNISPGPLS